MLSKGTGMGISGLYHDLLLNSAGTPIADLGWRSNMIVAQCDRLVAALMKNYQAVSAGEFKGISYLAIGEGDKMWDDDPHIPSPATKKLKKELFRLYIKPEQIKFLSEPVIVAGKPGPVIPIDKPTRLLEITVDIKAPELITKGYQPLREFGLFGGDATDRPNSGYLINYVVHPSIDLTEKLTLNRTIRLSFHNVQDTEAPDIPDHPLGKFPVTQLDGIGDAYARVLNAASIRTIWSLALIEPAAVTVGLPAMKLVELNAKARLALRTAAAVAPLPALLDQTLWNLLAASPEALSAKAGVSKKTIEKLRDQLGTLQLTLDNAFLQQLTLGQLCNASTCSGPIT